MFTRGPVFSMIPIDLSVAGSKDFNEACSTVIFVRAEDAAGALALDARVGVQLGDVASAEVPAGINALFKLRVPTSMVRFTWDAQPGVTAYFLLSADDQLMVHAPPARQLVTQAMGTFIETHAVAVGNVAVEIAPANASRQSVVVQNLSAGDLYIGGSSVAVGNGLKIPSNGTMTVDKTTADIYGVVASGSADVRVMVEY